MTPKEAQLLRAQRALSPARAPSSLAQRVAHAVVESRGSTDVVSDMRLGSEKTTQHAQSRTPIAALGIFFGLFLLIAWAAPSPRSSLGVPPPLERSGVVPTENRLVRTAQQVSAQSRAHQLEENSMRVLGRTGFVAVAAGGLGLAASSIALGQELVVNGGFEQSDYEDDCCPICGSGITIPGWSANFVDQLRAPEAPAGEWWVDLNQCSAGWIQQTVPTVVDRKYRLRFLLGSGEFSGCTPAVRLVQVSFGPWSETIEIQEGEGITAYEIDVTATSAKSVLRFEGLTGGCASGDLDNVSIEAILCGDVDNSGFADAIDLAIVLANWGVPSPKYPGADIDQNGVVDGADLSVLLSTWGACP